MIKINQNHLKLRSNYLFATINQKIKEFKIAHPELSDRIIKMGVGDVTRPLPRACVEAMEQASKEMGVAETFRGYPDYEGYDFLINDIITKDYLPKGVSISKDEVFISDGAKSDTANFQELFDTDVKIAVSDPVYPVYVDSNVMAGRSGDFVDGRWSNILYLEAVEENGFIPDIPKEKVDILYLCSPNNPTGQAFTRSQLKKFVDYALDNGSLIFFDAAYEAYITEPDIPRSIYEIPEAKKVAIEFKSFSKTAGFTGVRCAYCVVPKDIRIKDDISGEEVNLNRLWYRRQATKFNGVSYITQRGASATFTDQGQAEIKQIIRYYLNNANILKSALNNAGFITFGGVNSPYVWVKTPNGMLSWQFFDYMLEKLNIVGTPGVGFGKCGEGYFRFTAFSSKKNTEDAADRISSHKFNK